MLCVFLDKQAKVFQQNPILENYAPLIPDISEEELIDVINKLRRTNTFVDYYEDLLQKTVPHPQVIDLIFWPETLGYKQELTPEEIVKIARAYQPTQSDK